MAYSLIQVKEKKENILKLISEGKSINEIANTNNIPDDNTVYKWLNKDKQFREDYVRAREQQALFYAEKIDKVINDLPDEPTREQLDKARLKVDANKWIASKLLPKVYGSNQQQTNVQVNIAPITGMEIVDSSE